MRYRAFTLIEVLIATTVLGLGVLGLIAVLAGSATQQRAATMQNLSVGIATNAEDVLTKQLGRPGGNFVTIQDGQWTPSYMDPVTNYLTVFPGYLLINEPPPSGPIMNAGFIPGDVISGDLPPTNNQTATYTASSPSAFYINYPIDELNHRRINLQSGFVITFEILSYTPGNTRIDSTSTEVVFTAPPPPSPLNDYGNQDEISFSGGVTSNGLSLLSFNRRERETTGRARIESFTIPLDSTQFVNSISISGYDWRNDQLMSLSDRLVTEPDETMPGGKRPVLGYSALLRRTSASTQMCFITYSLRALARPTKVDDLGKRGFAFIPPDTELSVDTLDSVLREVEVQLGYEHETKRYFIEIDSNLEETVGWAMAQGQVLMMSSRFGVLGQSPDPSDPGADFPVRVLRRVTVTDLGGSTLIRAYLDRSPRVNGRSPIADLVTNDYREPIHVWGVYPVVKSLTDETEWALTPIEARVIQVADQ